MPTSFACFSSFSQRYLRVGSKVYFAPRSPWWTRLLHWLERTVLGYDASMDWAYVVGIQGDVVTLDRAMPPGRYVTLVRGRA